MKLKRFLATALSAVMVFNTLSEPITSMAMGNNSTDIPKAEAKFHELIGDESSSYEQKVDSLINAESFYEDYKKAEETVRKEFLSKLSDEETYELKAYAKYELVNAFVDLGTEPKKEDVEKVADYINLYAEIPSKELENPSIELDQKICKKISAKYDKQLNSYDTLNDYLQTILPFDIKEFFVYIDTFSSVDSENLAETVIKFRNYVLAVYGFDQQKEENVSEKPESQNSKEEIKKPIRGNNENPVAYLAEKYDKEVAVESITKLIESEDFSYNKVMEAIEETKHVAEIFTLLERETVQLFLWKLDSTELDQFITTYRYAILDIMIHFHYEDQVSTEQLNLITACSKLYGRFVVYYEQNLPDEETQDEAAELIIRHFNAKKNTKSKNLDEYNIELQSQTSFDIYDVLNKLQNFLMMGSPDELDNKIKSFNEFAFQLYNAKYSHIKDEILGIATKSENGRDDIIVNYSRSGMDFDAFGFDPCDTITYTSKEEIELPKIFTVTLANGEEKDIPVTWECKGFKDSKAKIFRFEVRFDRNYTLAEDLKSKLNKKEIVLPAICVQNKKLSTSSIMMFATPRAAPGYASHGTANWHNYKSGYYTMNGKRAYCLNHNKYGPNDATSFSEKTVTTANLVKAMYFGYEGPKPWSGFSSIGNSSDSATVRGYGKHVITSFAVSKIYSGTGTQSGYIWNYGWKNFDSYYKGQSIPGSAISLTNSTLTIGANGNSNTVTVNGTSGNSFTVTFPTGITCVKGGTNYTGTVTLKVGDSFYVKASSSFSGNWNSGTVYGANKNYRVRVFTPNTNQQPLGQLEAYNGGSVNFSIKGTVAPPKRHTVNFDLQGGYVKELSDSTYLYPANGWYNLKSAVAANKYVHIYNASYDNGAYFVTYDGKDATVNANNNKLYYLCRYYDTQYYLIINCKSGKCMQLDGNETNVMNGTTGGKNSKVYQYNLIWKSDGSVEADFLWSFKKVGNNISLINKGNNLALDVPNASTANAVILNMYPQNASVAQQFAWEPVATAGTNTIQSKYKIQGSTFNLPYINVYRTGYQFTGWNTAANGSGTSYKAGSNYTPDQDGGSVTMYSQYTPNTYKVVYNGNGATGGSTATSTHTYDTAKALTANGFTKTGHTFAGWATSASGGVAYGNGASVKNLTSTNGGTVNLYAKWTPNTYTITYNANGGSGAPAAHSYTYATSGTINLSSTKPTRTGYTFLGWSLSSSATSASYSAGQAWSKSNAANYTLYAVWKANTYTITYNANGGSGAPAAHSYTYATSGTINLSSTKPTRTGYTFLGWSLSSTATSASYSAGQAWARSNAANYTLYAVWKANSYAVTYAPNGGSGSNQTQSVTYNTAWTTKGATFSKTGYTQTSWNTAAAGNGTKYSLATAQGTWTRTSGLTLYAQYTPNTYKVVYNGNGATGGSTATSSHTYDVSKALTSNGFTRTGYTFKGWATSASGGVVYANGASVKNLTSTNGGTVNLYAVWQINSYTLTVNPNGGAFNGSSSVQSYTQNYGTSKPLPNPSKTGHTFGGWLLSGYGSINGMTTTDPTFKSGMGGVSVYNNSSGSHVAVSRVSAQADNPSDSAYELKITNTGTTTSPGNGGFYQSTLSKANTTYVHQFVAKIPVGYTLNIAHNSLGTGYSESWLTSRVGTGKWETYAYQIRTGSSGTFSTFGHVYITGGASSFTWYLSSSQITDISIKSYTYGAGNGTIVAQWNPIKYNIVYNGNGATGGSTASTEHIYNQAKALRSNGFTKTGYTFAGWATSATGNVVYSNGASVKNLTTSLNGTVNLYAKWTPNTYKVVYNGNGATGGSTASSSHTYDTAKALTANGFTKTGYTFAGWATSASGAVAYGNGASVKNLTSTNGGTVNLYAKWTPNSYAVTYAPNGGSGSNQTQSVTYNTAWTTKGATFSKTGYTQTSWNTVAAGNGTKYSLATAQGTWTRTSGLTLYAQYTPNTYKVVYNGNGATGGSTATSSHTYDTAKALTANGFTRTGYTFKGWATSASGAVAYGNGASVKNLTSTNGGTVNLYAVWQVNTYTNTIAHWAGGFKNSEGNNSSKNMFKLGDSSFTANYNSNYVMNESRKTTIPNGFYLASQFGTSSITGAWKQYAMGTTVTQKPNAMSYEYDYYPTTYNITYNLAGGANNSANPATYNVLYGVTLKNPTRAGYTFAGWYNGTTKVTGINEGKNATFTSASQLYSELATRQTGNIALTAKWTPNKYTVSYNGNGATSGSMSNSTATYDAPFITSKNAFAKTGYTFNGWNEKADGSGTKWTLSSYGVYEFGKPWTWTYTTNITLYAQWTPNKYTISYNGNGATGGSTASSNHTYDVASALTPNGFTKTDFKFIGWNTKPDGSGKSYTDKEVIKNLTSTDGATLQFYAQWEPTKVEVVYDANTGAGAAGNTTVTENVAWEKADNYLVRKNKTDIQFSKSRNTFAGWGSTNDANPKDPNLYVDSKDYNVNLKNESKSQQPRVATFSLRRALEEKPQTVDIGVTETGAPKVTFHATWDKAPTITVPGNDTSKVFYEGTTVTRADLLKNITASDEEDGTLTGQIKIVKIEYAAGRLVNGVKQNAYTKEWKTGMPDTETLDTWFMELDKNQSPVKHKVTFEVTDSAGNVTTATQTVSVKYNNFPTITANDRYFTLDEAQSGAITDKVLREEAIKNSDLEATDAEEGSFSNTSKITLLDFNAEEFKNFTESGYRKLTFHVQDTYGPNGKGKESICQITVYVVKDGEVPEVEKAKEVRFISEKYYNLNKDCDPNAMSEAEKETANDNGGLNVESKWYTDAEYKALIQSTFGKTTGDVYLYEYEDLEKIRNYVETHGIGNAKESDGLSKFAAQFMTGKYRK